VNLGSPINSVDDEFHGALSSDGLTFFLSAARTHDALPSPCDTSGAPPVSYGGDDLYASTWDSSAGAWMEPVNLGSSINGGGNESGPYPSVSADGHYQYLYFASSSVGNATRIYRSRKATGESCWEAAKSLPASINADGFLEADPALGVLNGNTFLFFARAITAGRFQIYASLVHTGLLDQDPLPDAAFEPPRPVSVSVPNFNNTKPTFFGETMFFASNRPGTCSITNVSCAGDAACPAGETCGLSQGGPDLWMATLSPDDTDGTRWSTPVNLGAGVNTAATERAPFAWVDPTGDLLLLFASTRLGLGLGDFYVTRPRAANRLLER
jgi:hypothetical protein